MGKGVRYTPEFREKTVGLLAESRDSHSSETRPWHRSPGT